MALLTVKFDTATGKFQGYAASATPPVDQDYDVGVGGQSEFVVTAPITIGAKIDVFVNGQKKREGASYDYTRDVGNNKIIFGATIPQNAWVQIRVWQ